MLQPLYESPSHCPKYGTTQLSVLGTVLTTEVAVTVTVLFVVGACPPVIVTYFVDVEVVCGLTVTVITLTVSVTVTTTCC